MPEKNLLYCPKCNNEFPSQGRGRYVQIVDVVREHQYKVGLLLRNIHMNTDVAKDILSGMHKSDRDALLQENGIFTPEQIELLK